jgi:hypothetical protein
MRLASISVALLLFVTCAMAAALPETRDSRLSAARVCAKAMDISGRLDEAFANITKDLEPGEREEVRSPIKKEVHTEALREIGVQALADNFSARQKSLSYGARSLAMIRDARRCT